MRFTTLRNVSLVITLLGLTAGPALPVHAQSSPFSLPSWHQLLAWLSPLWPGGLDSAGASADPYGGTLPPGDAGASADPDGLWAPGDEGHWIDPNGLWAPGAEGWGVDPNGRSLRSVWGREGASADPHGVPVAPETKMAPGDEGHWIDPNG